MNIEEDIKIINNFVQNIENGFVTSSVISSWNPEKRIVKAIEHLLAEREEDKKRIKELEEENRIFKDSNVLVNRYFKLKDNSIPVQKVKDLLTEIQEEYNKLDKEIDKQIKDKNKDYYKCKENIAIMQTLAYCRDKFEGLLEDK